MALRCFPHAVLLCSLVRWLCITIRSAHLHSQAPVAATLTVTPTEPAQQTKPDSDAITQQLSLSAESTRATSTDSERGRQEDAPTAAAADSDSPDSRLPTREVTQVSAPSPQLQATDAQSVLGEPQRSPSSPTTIDLSPRTDGSVLSRTRRSSVCRVTPAAMAAMRRASDPNRRASLSPAVLEVATAFETPLAARRSSQDTLKIGRSRESQVAAAVGERFYNSYLAVGAGGSSFGEFRSCLTNDSFGDDRTDLASLAAEVVSLGALVDAYHNASNNRRLAYLENVSSRQLLFIAACYSKCIGSHYPVSESLCDAALRHIPEFAQAFRCAPGTPMNPHRRCRLF
ncbi:uncharacterized protein LOC144094508 [Amblyomma americanum]